MMDLTTDDQAVIARLLGEDDFGLNRLQRAERRRQAGEEVCRQVAARHGLALLAVTDPKQGVKRRHHVVMARSHAAHVMREMGFSGASIAKVLRCDRSAARRLAIRWDDFKAGRLDTVSKEQAREVDRIVAETGATKAEACNQVGVGFTGYECRKVMMIQGRK